MAKIIEMKEDKDGVFKPAGIVESENIRKPRKTVRQEEEIGYEYYEEEYESEFEEVEEQIDRVLDGIDIGIHFINKLSRLFK